ncbi:MAG TPA: DUF948 domain-containing protein [Actinomycetota bacterium]|nr:DUF948 domain-containing protein [Actinomycetota bacterium]
MTWGQVALLIIALAVVALVAVLGVVLSKVAGLLTDVTLTLNDVRKETMPLLTEVRTTVTTLNVEMDRVDGILASAETAAASVSNVARLVTAATANPVIKALAFLTGAGVGVKALKRRKRSEEEREAEE